MAALALAPAEAGRVAGNLSPKLEWELANPKWAATLNPVLANPLINGSILSGIKLKTGFNLVNHLLGRKLQGYIVVLKDANVDIYDSQAVNPYPDLTVVLNASGAATISLYVF